MLRKLCSIAIVAAAAVTLWAQEPHRAAPLEPVSAILDAFRAHEIVALGEGRHNNEQGYAFRLALIRDPRLATMVNDIVVESGSSKYQDVMDRFIRGESVPDTLLRRAWQDTTVPAPPGAVLPPGIVSPTDRLKQHCASQPPK